MKNKENRKENIKEKLGHGRELNDDLIGMVNGGVQENPNVDQEDYDPEGAGKVDQPTRPWDH